MLNYSCAANLCRAYLKNTVCISLRYFMILPKVVEVTTRLWENAMRYAFANRTILATTMGILWPGWCVLTF